MITKHIYFFAFVAFAVASCHFDHSEQCNQNNGQWCDSQDNASLLREAEVAEGVLDQCSPGQIVSNQYNCVRQILRNKAATWETAEPREPQVQHRRSSSGRIVSNDCKCVKTVLRHKPVIRVSVVPTERRVVQTFTKPVIKKYQYKCNPPQRTEPALQYPLSLGSVSIPSLVSTLNQPLQNIDQPIFRSNCPELNAESHFQFGPSNCGSQIGNCEEGLLNLSQFPSC